MAWRWEAISGRARNWLPAVTASACLALAGCGYAAAGQTGNHPAPAACARITSLDQLTMDRLNPLHQKFRFAAPARITVTDAPQVQAVARALCNLPPMGKGAYSCPADSGISYKLRFAARHHWFRPVKLGVSGCATVSGLGQVRHVTSGFFWRVLGKAAGLPHASVAAFAGTPRT
jgi:hypothetical protein